MVTNICEYIIVLTLLVYASTEFKVTKLFTDACIIRVVFSAFRMGTYITFLTMKSQVYRKSIPYTKTINVMFYRRILRCNIFMKTFCCFLPRINLTISTTFTCHALVSNLMENYLCFSVFSIPE